MFQLKKDDTLQQTRQLYLDRFVKIVEFWSKKIFQLEPFIW